MLCGTCLFAQEPNNQDLKVILEKTFLNPNAEGFLNMMAVQAINESGKEMDTEDLVSKFKGSFEDAETLAKFAEPYRAVFSDEEIAQIRKIYETPVFEKYSMQGNQVFQSTFQTLNETFKALAEKHGIEKKIEETAASILEITKDNFETTVEESELPMVVDVYSSNCPPCKLMEPIFKELSNEYKDRVVFGKINCDTESELAKKYDVQKLPTILFINPGEETPAMATSGFTSKKDMDAKIGEFLKSAQ